MHSSIFDERNIIALWTLRLRISDSSSICGLCAARRRTTQMSKFIFQKTLRVYDFDSPTTMTPPLPALCLKQIKLDPNDKCTKTYRISQ